MSQPAIHQCECKICQSNGQHPDQAHHHHINVLLSRLDEQQRRWYVAVEAERMGYGGSELLSQVTGMHVSTIRKGRQELVKDLAQRPIGRVRLEGGGRKSVEKKGQPQKQLYKK